MRMSCVLARFAFFHFALRAPGVALYRSNTLENSGGYWFCSCSGYRAGMVALQLRPANKASLASCRRHQQAVTMARARHGRCQDASSSTPPPARLASAALGAALIALLAPCQPALAAASDTFYGPARVVDGDTLVVAQQRIRM